MRVRLELDDVDGDRTVGGSLPIETSRAEFRKAVQRLAADVELQIFGPEWKITGPTSFMLLDGGR